MSLLSMLPALALHAAAPTAPPPAAGRCSLTLCQPEPVRPGPRHRDGGAVTGALRCGPAGCAGGPGAVAQTWSCPAR